MRVRVRHRTTECVNITNIKMSKNSRLFTNIKTANEYYFYHFKHFRKDILRQNYAVIMKVTGTVQCYRLQ